ncbi:MAG: exodeoxyribonuclease VII small subunit [Candidatus Hinthialibacter sp.]
MKRTPKEESFDFEEGMKRLEEIIAKFDEGGLPLEQMESFFVEGMELVKKCAERLDRAETRVTELLQDSEMGWNEAAYDDSDEGDT